MRPAEPGRNALLAAGREVLRQRGVSALSINAVVAEAGLAKGTFYAHFPDRTSFVLALHRQLHEQLAAAVVEVIDGMPPGVERLRTGFTIYADACHDHKEALALLGEARYTPALARGEQEDRTEMGKLLLEDLAAIGWEDPERITVLLTFAGTELALTELVAGRALPDLREAYFALATGLRGPAA